MSDASGFRRHMQGLAVSRVLGRNFLEAIYPVKLNPAPSQSAADTGPFPTPAPQRAFWKSASPRSPVLQDLAGPRRTWPLLRTPFGRHH